MNSNQSGLQFSIIIPTYNRGELIKTAIASALNQNFENFEVIIVDDGSTDNTEAIVNSINNPRLSYYKKQNAERAAARNYGAERAKGEYLTFLDSDDVLYSHYLLNALNMIKKHNSPPFFHLAYEIKNENGKIISKVNFVKSDSYEFLVYGNPLSCIGAFVKRSIFNSFKFNEDRRLTLSEDWELWLRLVANFGIKTDSKISAAMIFHDERSVLKAEEEKLLLRKKLSMQFAFEDTKVREKFQKSYKKISSHFGTYISLHLALAKKKRRAFFYLKEAFFENPRIIFNKRFYSIFRHLIFN